MINFNNFVQNIIYQENLIKQGGNAFTNVSPIKLKFIKSTVNAFIKDILYPTYNLIGLSNIIFPLGSTGKKEQSGDIDLAVNTLLLPENNVKDSIKKIYTYTKLYTTIEVIINPISNDMLQFSYPVKQTNQNVQIDLLFTAYPTFTKWYMHSPQIGTSKYKAAHRNELLRAIPKTITLQQLQYKNNQLVKWQQQDITPIGVYKQTQTLVDENNNRLMYKDTQLLLPQYAKIEFEQPITHSPIKTYERYIGNYNPYNVHTFQQLFKIITSTNFKFKQDLEDILYTAHIMFKNNDKLEFPVELS